MLGSLRKLGLLLDGPDGVHPDFAELLAYHDGELGSRRTAWVARHLAGCCECGAEVDGIDPGLRSCADALEETGPVPPAAEGLERLMRVIRDETQLRAEQERLRNERNSRIVAELKTYFGSYPRFC